MAAAPVLLVQQRMRGLIDLSPVRALTGFTLLAVVVSLLARACVGLQTTLWLDESWTGAFASEHSLAALTDQIRNDVNAPAYYYLMFFWAKLFGLSNLALRLPSVLFSLAAPVLAWAGLRRQYPSVALVWCALLALWLPGIMLSGYARCYSLLVLVVTLNLVVFTRALTTASLKQTALWVATASLAVLVHYHAAFLALAEAAVFAVVQRRRLLALWPAALAAAPALAWIAYHAPRLAQFARPDVAWYDRLSLADLPAAVAFAAGSALALILIAVALPLAVLLSRRDAAEPPLTGANLSPLWWACGSAALAAIACLAVAVLRPSFALRYLTPFVPGLLLLVACAVERLGRGRWQPAAVLIGGFTAVVVMWMAQTGIHPGDQLYSYERASSYLAGPKANRLVFFWDHPATPMEAPRQLDLVGGFFMRRAGLPVTVVPIYPAAGRDMTKAVLAAAGSQGTILWMYDTAVRGTQARAHLPRIAEMDPSFTCKDFGRRNIGVLACRRKGTP